MMKFTLFIGCFLIFLFSYAAAPTTQASGFKVLDNNAWKFSFSFSAASGGAEGYLIMMNTSNNFDIPINLKPYKAGQSLGNNKVLYSGNVLSQNVNPTSANTKYYIKIYAYNTVTSPSYNLTNPLLDSITTAGSTEGNYFKNIDAASTSFISDLTKLLFAHTFRTYDDYEKIIVPSFYERDTVINDTSKKVVQCEYSNEIKIYMPPFNFGNNNLNYSREHVLAKNWMNKRGIPNSDLIYYPEGSDYHNLLLTRTSNVNSSRSDYPYGKVNFTISNYLQCKFGKDINNNYVFEPKQNIKGNGARCMFYQMVCYNGSVGGSWAIKDLNPKGSFQSEVLLKEWHTTDSVDNAELARNELIFSLQGSRNPFIDHPDWVDCIDFTNLVRLKCSSIISENKIGTLDLYVKNDGNQIRIRFNAIDNFPASIEIINLLEQIVYSKRISIAIGENHLTIDHQMSENQLFYLRIQSPSMKTVQPIPINY